MINLKNTDLYKKTLFRDFLIIFLLITAILFFQNFIIYPFEKYLFNSAAIEYVSLIFLPHGVKIILYLIYQLRSIIPVFLATYIYDFSLPINYSHFFGSLIGVLAISVSFQLCSYLLNPVSFDNSQKQPLWRLLIVVTIMSSLINAILQSVLASLTFKEYNLNMLFLGGDLIGSFVVIILVIYFRAILLKIIPK